MANVDNVDRTGLGYGGRAAAGAARTARPLALAAAVAGIGLGGFFDGIVLHQILQWHHMVSVPVPPDSVANLQLNTLADGLFHALAWVATAIALVLLWRAARTPGAIWGWGVLIGGLLLGWGLFNVVEGVVDHHLLQIHHVRPGPNQTAWDVAFLAWGALMLVAGWLLVRRGARAAR